MWAAYTLFREYAFHDYGTLRTAVLTQLGGLAEHAPATERVRIEVPAELDVQLFVVAAAKNW